MPSKCCFWCPAKDFRKRAPDEVCPNCGRSFNLPLTAVPASIGGYDILSPIDRGFYGAVYRAEQRALKRLVVLKVVPQALYAYFGKDWVQECEEHAKLAASTPLIADITDRFDADVDFGGAILPCHVAVLANVPGPTLEQLLAQPDAHNLTPRMAAQIAADLFEILASFARNERFHNDLHGGNIIVQRLPVQSARPGVIEPTVRAVAIDLGSVKDGSLSGGTRLGDHTHVAVHIASLAKAVAARYGQTSDVAFRITAALRGLAEHLSPAAGAQRIMTSDDALRTIRFAVDASVEPWRQPLSLARFGDAYNAQALESWHVPDLWWDPGGRWVKKTTARGPQVITGMRGCGKTMLLRALHFHARVVQSLKSPGTDDVELKDDFVGVYASCQKLLNPQVEDQTPVPYAFERLFVAYVRDVVQVLRHLRSLAPTALSASIENILAPAMSLLEYPTPPVTPSDEQQFDQSLIELQFKLSDGAAGYRLRVTALEAFAELARCVRSASPLLANKYVFFLLDDVSTRYLKWETVREVISALVFQHAHCAFRITTEAQALHRVLLSPGGAPADPNRDYEGFDLGNEVYSLLQDSTTRDRVQFISEILRRRGQKFDDLLYRKDPVDVLGDTPLETIAKEIAGSAATSAARKQVYRGVRAVQAACVGDLGDVVKLYEKILHRAGGESLPVAAEKQTECFLEHSAGLMHFLNRRDQHKKAVALAFAQAAGELLHRSGKHVGGGPVRLRQYTKLYVRVDAEKDYEAVASQLLDLLDAGVFVYDGGAPRTKTRDNDPVMQFKLSFRKMLGLASFIGLSDRDRFELSGEALRRFIQEPEHAKKILLDSEAKTAQDDDEVREATETVTEAVATAAAASPGIQLELAMPTAPAPAVPRFEPSLGLRVHPARLDEWRGRPVDRLVLALGFEDRALVSAKRLLERITPRQILAVRYSVEQGRDVEHLIRSIGCDIAIVNTGEDLSQALSDGGDILVDTSGLSKPFLFTAVRDSLRRTGRVAVVHTTAERHYPTNEELESRGVVAGETLTADAITKAADVLTGESGPYRAVEVHCEQASPDRTRALIASASPKNDRLLHLLDLRGADATRILVPPPTTPRRRLAWTSAELAASAADSNVGLARVDTNDIETALRVTEELYSELYFRSGANVEIGLTGSKIHAVAFAAVAAAARVAAAWYVAPYRFDEEKFTEGAGETQCFDITMTPVGRES